MRTLLTPAHRKVITQLNKAMSNSNASSFQLFAKINLIYSYLQHSTFMMLLVWNIVKSSKNNQYYYYKRLNLTLNIKKKTFKKRNLLLMTFIRSNFKRKFHFS